MRVRHERRDPSTYVHAQRADARMHRVLVSVRSGALPASLPRLEARCTLRPTEPVGRGPRVRFSLVSLHAVTVHVVMLQHDFTCSAGRVRQWLRAALAAKVSGRRILASRCANRMAGGWVSAQEALVTKRGGIGRHAKTAAAARRPPLLRGPDHHEHDVEADGSDGPGPGTVQRLSSPCQGCQMREDRTTQTGMVVAPSTSIARTTVAGARWVLSLVTALALLALASCGALDGPSRSGPAVITFDDVYVGSKGSMGTEYPEVTCFGDKRPQTIVHRDRGLDAYQGDWRPYGRWDEPQIRMRLESSEYSPLLARMSVEFRIGDAVYHSDAAKPLRVDPGWAGSAVFEDVPLVSGEPYEGRHVLRRLSIDWDCWVQD